MAKQIEIHDKSQWPGGGSYLAVTLDDILRAIVREGSALTWAAFDLEGVGEFANLREAWGDEGQVVLLTWDELTSFAPEVIQLVWGIFVGGQATNLQGLSSAMADSEIFNRSEIIIEAFDGTFWRFFAQDDHLVKRVRKSFTQVVDASEFRLGEG